MTSQRTAGWGTYDMYYYGMSRGFIREAINRTDLAEGVHWLILTRTNTFPQVKRAWQRITRSGNRLGFVRSRCPLCLDLLKSRQDDLSHLLVACEATLVATSREKHLKPCITYLDRVKQHIWESAINTL